MESVRVGRPKKLGRDGLKKRNLNPEDTQDRDE